MIVLSQTLVERTLESGGMRRVGCVPRDGGDVYTVDADDDREEGFEGIVQAADNCDVKPAAVVTNQSSQICVVVSRETNDAPQPTRGVSTSRGFRVKGFTRLDGEWLECPVQVIPCRKDLFSRFYGILETDALAGMTVLVIGLGSVGSYITRLLSESGIDDFILIDDDRIEVGNVLRHEGGISDIGRYKTKFCAERIWEKNPYARVRVFEKRVCGANAELLRRLVREACIVINTVDERAGKLICNRICIEESMPVVYAGAFRRAYGGQVLRVRPSETICYQCFAQTLPAVAADVEIANQELAAGIAYSNEPVPIEPGLSINISPISVMAANMVVQELLRGKPTTLRSLDEDLSAAWYIYLNRREQGTQYEGLEPLGCDIDGFRILRWYGVAMDKDPHCPVCGDGAIVLDGHQAVTADAADIESIELALGEAEECHE